MTATLDVLGRHFPTGPGVRTARIEANRPSKKSLDPNSQGTITNAADEEEDDPFLPTDEQLLMINKYSLKQLKKEQLWVVKIRGCDNQPDRHNDRILVPALNQLAPTFIGRVGLSDHRWSSTTQTSRIFNAYVSVDNKEASSVPGEPYTCLVFEQYMLRTEGNAAFRGEVEAGIKKETSVGFLLKWSEVLCSVCGDKLWTWESTCPHLPGSEYLVNGVKVVCLGLIPAHEGLEGVENSWVAVPAQPRAGAVHAQKDAEGDELRRQLMERKEKQMDANRLIALLSSPEELATWLKDQPAEVQAKIKELMASKKEEPPAEESPPAEETPPAEDPPASEDPPVEGEAKGLVPGSAPTPIRLELDTQHFELIGKQIAESIVEVTKGFDAKLEGATKKVEELEAQVKELSEKLNAQLAPLPGGPLIAGFDHVPSPSNEVPGSVHSNKNAAGGELGNRVAHALMAELAEN